MVSGHVGLRALTLHDERASMGTDSQRSAVSFLCAAPPRCVILRSREASDGPANPPGTGRAGAALGAGAVGAADLVLRTALRISDLAAVSIRYVPGQRQRREQCLHQA